MSSRHDAINGNFWIRGFILALAPMLGCWLSGCTAAPGPASPLQSAAVQIEFEAPDGLTFVGVVDHPEPSLDTGWGVLLIGGGLGNDLDWSTPGSVVAQGQALQLTIDGSPHADAPALSAALVARGFTVMRWSTLAKEDPLAGEWPARATPRSLEETLIHTRAALEAFRADGGVDPDRIILLGHSLGAARACAIADGDQDIAALILLSPAYFTRRDRMPASFEQAGMRPGAEVVAERGVPCLIILGEFDASRAVDRLGVLESVDPDLATIVLLPGVGHNLGPEVEGRVGPIDAGAPELVANWAANLRAEP